LLSSLEKHTRDVAHEVWTVLYWFTQGTITSFFHTMQRTGKPDRLSVALLAKLHGRVRSHVVDAALVLATDHADVALFTPRGAPRVLDNPVVLRALAGIANSQHTMVQLGATSSREDATRVELESGLVSLNGN